MARLEALPPVVRDLIRSASDPKGNVWQRDNACQMLENIEEACRIAAKQFRREQIKFNTKAVKAAANT